MFKDAYRRRRCILPVDGFFEWKAIKEKAKQPYAIAMKDGKPFGIGLSKKEPKLSNSAGKSYGLFKLPLRTPFPGMHEHCPLRLGLGPRYAR